MPHAGCAMCTLGTSGETLVPMLLVVRMSITKITFIYEKETGALYTAKDGQYRLMEFYYTTRGALMTYA